MEEIRVKNARARISKDNDVMVTGETNGKREEEHGGALVLEGSETEIIKGSYKTDRCSVCILTDEGDASGGDGSAVRTDEGNVSGGDGSAVRTAGGDASVGDCGVAMGTSVRVGKNSVGVVLDDDGDIIKVLVNVRDGGGIEVKVESKNEATMGRKME